MTAALGGSKGDVVFSAGIGAFGGGVASFATRAAVGAWRVVAPSGLGGTVEARFVQLIDDRGSDIVEYVSQRIPEAGISVLQGIIEAFLQRWLPSNPREKAGKMNI